MEERFKRLAKSGEIIIGAVIVFGLLIIQLPIVPAPNKTVIYGTAVIISIFTLIWHKLKVPVSPMNKNFIESLVDLIAIAIVVHATGGARSYFNFLYLLPNIDTSTTSTRWHTFLFWLATSVLLFIEAIFFSSPDIHFFGEIESPPISLAILNVWAVGLVTVYGRYLAKESETAEEAAVVATIEKERSINQLKDEFLFIISHELRGPITAIRGYLELLLTGGAGQISAPVKDLTNAGFRQSERLNDLIAELLDLSRLETGKLKLSNENFNLNNFLNELLKTFISEADKKKIKFTFSPSKQEIIVFADKDRVREVILNLIENAIKYTGEFGSVSVWVEVKDHEVYTSVADSGVGISEDDLPHLFDRFYNPTDNLSIEQGQSEKQKTVGLGLFLIKNLVEKMGGKIFVESRVGKGSKFTFTLPLAKSSGSRT